MKIKFPKKFPKEKSLRKLEKELDKAVSDYLKAKSKGICVRCGKHRKNMGVSHYWSRKHRSTRWEIDNLDWMCWLPCHYTAEHEKQGWYRDYMIGKLGERGYQTLMVKANTVTKFSRQDIQLLINFYENKARF